GRYSEVTGESGLDNDLVNRSFEIPKRSEEDYKKVEEPYKSMVDAFAAGLNYYLAKHPEVHPRLLTHFEPWYLGALERNNINTHLYGQLHVDRTQGHKMLDYWRSSQGSN